MVENTIEEIKSEVKKLLVRTLDLKNIEPEDILDDRNFFTGENVFKMDSIDSLELVLEIQRQFKVKINNQNLASTIIISVNSISEFVYNERDKNIS
jgi:acyl carrier protein